MSVLRIESQGRLLRLRFFHGSQQRAYRRRSRGRVSSFSRRSRKYLLEMASRIDWPSSGVKFVTLTYRVAPSPFVAKYHLKKLLLWLRRRHHSFWAVWRMEFQRRGAVHFHLVLVDAGWLDLAALTRYWQSMTGDDSYPDVKPIKSSSHRRVVAYLAKYVAKPAGLDCLSKKNLRPSGFVPVMSWRAAPPRRRRRWLGRFWGIVGRSHVPWADLRVADVPAEHPWSRRFAVHAARSARRLLADRGLRYLPRFDRGFTLFLDHPVRPVLHWFNLASADLGYPSGMDSLL